MTKEYLIQKVSKVEQTFEDEFKAEFNSPELLWENFLEFELFELLNFINSGYSPFGTDWIRKSDDKIIYNLSEILQDFANRWVS